MITYTVEIYEAGSERWFHNDKLHREDGPAVENAKWLKSIRTPNGDKRWFLNGKGLSESKWKQQVKKSDCSGNPSFTYTVEISDTGDKRWYLNGKLHREDGPAIETTNGKHWYINNILHREDGPASEMANGDKYWYLNGKLHRGDGPASEYVSGTKEWYLNGKLHRENGPAIEYADGDKYWVLNGKQLSESAWKQQVKKSKSDCSGKVVEIDGKKYKLMEI